MINFNSFKWKARQKCWAFFIIHKLLINYILTLELENS